MHYSQAGQDEWVIQKTKGKKYGYFVDLGAYDGIKYSNTYYLEKDMYWTGICIEADPVNFSLLSKNRKCICKNLAVSNISGNFSFISSDMGGKLDANGETDVECNTLLNILYENKSPKKIDYLSIDIEGKELDVIKDFPFSEWEIKLITIEHNLYCNGEYNKKEIMRILTNNGYILDRENVSHNGYPFEDWYILK